MSEIAARRATSLWSESWPEFRKVAFAGTVIVAVVAFRLLWDRFLDPFEDGYQNWWIASSFVETGHYADPFSGMTRGNWLPGFTIFLAAPIAIAGSHIMPLLKGLNIVFALGTAALVYGLARPRGQRTAAIAVFLFALSATDIVIASFVTPESLTLFAAFSGVFLVERRPFGTTRSLLLAAGAFAIAAALRYEAWGFVALYLLWTWRQRGITRRELAALGAPAALFAVAWLIWTSQFGFLPSIIIGQTSTDVRYKESIGAIAPVADRLGSFFSRYLAWTPFAIVALAWAVWAERKASFTPILGFFYAAEVIYTLASFGNPSPRYIHLTVPIVSIYTAAAVVAAGRRIGRSVRRLERVGPWIPQGTAVFVAVALAILVVNPTPTPGFLTSGMQRAGIYLDRLPLPEGKILVSESPIAAYYSGYPASRIEGSTFLPSDAANASAYLVVHAAYVVMVTVPYYRLRTLFPDQANGTNGNHLALLYDATGPEYDLGAPRVLVFQVVA